MKTKSLKQYNDENSYRIYSRKRLRIAGFSNNPKMSRYKRKVKKSIPILIIMIIAFVTLYNVLNYINPIFETLCKDKAKDLATIITNEQSTLVVENYDYYDFFTIERHESENIKMISANVLTINQVTSSIAINIQNEINNNSRNEIKIALGSVTGIKILSGMGPEITAKISTSGSVDTDLKSEFISQGINQTLHRVYLEIRCTINILTPSATLQNSIVNQVLLGENVIIGEIPENYFNINK